MELFGNVTVHSSITTKLLKLFSEISELGIKDLRGLWKSVLRMDSVLVKVLCVWLFQSGSHRKTCLVLSADGMVNILRACVTADVSCEAENKVLNTKSLFDW